jgi:hypothetical protein
VFASFAMKCTPFEETFVVDLFDVSLRDHISGFPKRQEGIVGIEHGRFVESMKDGPISRTRSTGNGHFLSVDV